MAEKLTRKDYQQKERDFVDKLKDVLDLELQVMEASGADNAKETKREYIKKVDLLNAATYRPISDTFGGTVNDEIFLAKKENRFHDYDNMNYYDIAEILMGEYEVRIQAARSLLLEHQSKQSLEKTVLEQNEKAVNVEPSQVVGIAKSQGLKSELESGFKTEVSNNITPQIVDRYVDQLQARKQES